MTSLPSLPEPAELLRAYATRAKKRFGQHFLTDARLLDRIVHTASVEAGDTVLEIGPGCGTLTTRLLAAGAQVVAVELDRDAAAFVRETFEAQPLTLVEADATAVDFAALVPDGARVVANLPYNVGTQILFALLESGVQFQAVAVMLQLEVAQRMTAAPGTKAYGAMTLRLQDLATVDLAFRVKPGAFTPPPKVDSAVVRVLPRAAPTCPEPLRELFGEVVDAGFAARRKTIRNGLKSRFGADLAAHALAAAGVDERARAEVLAFDDFVALAAAIQAETQ